MLDFIVFVGTLIINFLFFGKNFKKLDRINRINRITRIDYPVKILFLI